MRVIVVAAAAALGLAGTALAAGGDPTAGKQKSQTCAACHGPDGNSENPIYPILAGQYPDYLFHALRDYKSGARSNPVMQGLAGALSDQDMRDLAAWFANQESALHTPPPD